MIEDLLGSGESVLDAGIVVIGAGTLGLPVAAALAARGLSVVCLESGGWTQRQQTHPLNEVVHTRLAYAGASAGRFRCLGGASTRWGGALIPFLRSDIEGASWPVSYSDIIAYRPAVERLFGLPDGPYEAPGLMKPIDGEPTHIPRLAKWPPFTKRNVFNLLQGDVRTRSNLRVIINATATGFEVREGALCHCTARAPDGSSIRVKARRAIIAAGAIESTRLLLLLDQQNQGCLKRQGDQLGRYFHDHLSVRVAGLKPLDRRTLNRLAGFQFEKGGAMRNLRFELAETKEIRSKFKPCFAHIAFEEKEERGFGSLRDIYRFLQMRRVPPLSRFLSLALDAPWLVRSVWWRFVERRLLYPGRADITVHMVIEQTQRSDNRIRLAADKADVFGRALAQIEWSVSEEDLNNLRDAAGFFEKAWNNSNLGKIATFERRSEGEAEAELISCGGIYHPCGSTRMGASPETGVVDSSLKVFGLSNVYVVSTSVLPTGGGANPTMMAAMLAFRCVDHLVSEIAAELPASGSQKTTAVPKELSLSGA